MKVSRKLVVILVVFLMVGAAFAYFYAEYFSPPFQEKWSKNEGQIYFSSEMGDIINNGTFYWLKTSNIAMPGSNDSLELIAQNLSHGNEVWSENINLSVPGLDLYATGDGVIVNTLPHIYYYNADIIFLSYEYGYKIDNYTNYTKPSQIGIVAATFNSLNGSIVKIRTYNESGASPGVPIEFSRGMIYSGSIQQLGLTYYLKGNLTGNYEMNLFGIGLFNDTHWNTTYQWQANAYMSNVFPLSLSYGRYLAAIVQNSRVYVLNSYNGSLIWNKTSSYAYYNPVIASGNLYYAVKNSRNYSVEYLSLATGKNEGNFSVSSPYVTITQGHILVLQNGSYSSYSLSGTLQWVVKVPYANVDNYASFTDTSSKGNILFSSVRTGFPGNGAGGIDYTMGIYGYYSIVNLSSGKMLWSKSYYPLSQVLNKQGMLYVPVKFDDNYVIYSWSTNNGTEHIVAADLSEILR